MGAFSPAPPTSAWTSGWVELRLNIRTRISSFDFGSGELPSGSDGDMAFTAPGEAIAEARI